MKRIVVAETKNLEKAKDILLAWAETHSLKKLHPNGGNTYCEYPNSKKSAGKTVAIVTRLKSGKKSYIVERNFF